MLGTSTLIAFCATAKPAAAKHFYHSILGLALIEESPFALVFDANGTELRVQKVSEVALSGYTTVGWAVAGIERLVEGLAAQGIACEIFPGLQQSEYGIWVASDGSKVAWFRDPDGNILSLSEYANA